MIPYSDKIKINDFKEAYRKIMNPNNNENIDKVINDLFYNVECNYEEYYSTVPYVSADKEQYKFHILQPIDGKYSLLDFLLNRAISNLDGFYIKDENAYDHRKVLLINAKRYEKPEYSEKFKEEQYQKSRLHETGHALHIWDTMNDNSIHGYKSINYCPDFVEFKEKVQGFEQLLGHKYTNILHSSEIENADQKQYSIVNGNSPFKNHSIDEVATEYFATKYSGLYEKDGSEFRWVRITEKPKELVIAVPNYLNGYASATPFIYHLDHLVSKPSMFESMFFESDQAVREFCDKYATQIENVCAIDDQIKKLSEFPDAYSKFSFLLKTACHIDRESPPEDIQKEKMLAHQLLDWIFAFAYEKEFDEGNISKEEMSEIMVLTYNFLPMVVNPSVEGNLEKSFIREWYEDENNFKGLRRVQEKDDENKSNTRR